MYFCKRRSEGIRVYDAAVAGRAQGNILMCKVGRYRQLPTYLLVSSQINVES